MRIPHPKKIEDPLYPWYYAIIGQTKGGIYKSCAFEGLMEMFEVDSVDTCGRKFPLMLMGAEQRV